MTGTTGRTCRALGAPVADPLVGHLAQTRLARVHTDQGPERPV